MSLHVTRQVRQAGGEKSPSLDEPLVSCIEHGGNGPLRDVCLMATLDQSFLCLCQTSTKAHGLRVQGSFQQTAGACMAHLLIFLEHVSPREGMLTACNQRC